MRRPEIHVTPPGPRSREVVKRDDDALVTSTKTSPIAVRRAQGVWVEDVDGNTLLDFTAGISVVNTGHGHPRVVEAIRRQAGELVHFAGTDFYYEAQVKLAERLNALVPGDVPRRTFFTNSGTESNEAALKVARVATGRPRFLAFLGAFHGRSLGSLALTASKPVQQRGFYPTLPGVVHTPYPNPYRNPWGIDGYDEPDALVDAALGYIDTLFKTHVPPDEVAAVFVEPIQGEGGYVVPPEGFHPRLKALCEEHGILLAADEVQTGFGRTGKLFAMEHWGVAPDIVSLAKAIASGVPMGATVVRADLNFPTKGSHSNTYGGNVLASAAALATLDVIQEEGLVENAATEGAYLKQRLHELQDAFPAIGDVRGRGLMLATDLVKDPATREPDPATRDRLVRAALERGLILLPCGTSALRYIPPLTITRDEVDAGVEVLEAALKAVANG